MFSQCAVSVAAFTVSPTKVGLQQGEDAMGDLYRRCLMVRTCLHEALLFLLILFLDSEPLRAVAIVRFVPSG